MLLRGDDMRPQAVARILDANLDRAREGLRVLEEWFRFGLDSGDWSAECKEMRQALARWHSNPLRSARDTSHDQGTLIDHPDEFQRKDLEHVLQANCSRVQEALRVLEEYGKLAEIRQLVPPGMAKICQQMRYRLYEIENELLCSTLHHRLRQAHVYLVTHPGPDWFHAVERAVQGGVSIVQYRHKAAHDREALADLLKLRALCDHYQTLLIVNDRVDLALLCKADGVHLGQTDMQVHLARELLGPRKLIGLSTTSPEEISHALTTSADYLGVGPVYATPIKADRPPAGLELVRYALSKVTIPFFLIGGIDLDKLPELRAVGAQRVAVVRALMEAADPTQTARLMVAELSGSPDGRFRSESY